MPDNASGDSSQRKAAEKNRRGADYARIEQVLLETSRGRWFLAEYARGNRGAETQRLLEAIAKLERTMLGSQRQQGLCSVVVELLEMREAIARTRREVAALKLPDQFESQIGGASEDLDQTLEAAERARCDILRAAEEIQEVAWMLRERRAEIGFCDTLDRRATDIYAACSFQDITGQRTKKALDVLRFVEQRINIMIEIWGGDVGLSWEALQPSNLDDETDLLGAPRLEDGGPRQGIGAMLDTGLGTGIAPPAGTAEFQASSATMTEHPKEERRASEKAQTFEVPEPLRLATLHAVKRAALFG